MAELCTEPLARATQRLNMVGQCLMLSLERGERLLPLG
jgi:hypothetical protein